MTIGKKIALGLALTLAVIVAVGCLAAYATAKLAESEDEASKSGHLVAHTYEVLAKLEAVLTTLTDAETGQRGYLLTGDDPYLEPYRNAKDRIDHLLADLKELTKDNQDQQGRLEELGPKVRAKFQELQETIDLRGQKDKGPDAALAVVKTDKGKQVMDDIRKTVGAMKGEENHLLQRRDDEAKHRDDQAQAIAHLSQYAIWTATALAVLVIGGGGLLLTRSITTPVREAVAQLGSAGAELLATSQQQAAGAQEQAASVAQTVATVTEVTQTAEQAAQRSRALGEAVQRNLEVGKAGRQVVEASIAALDRLKEQVEATAGTIMALAEQAQQIGEIIAAVNDIAEQTNLLALNAAIEASRAGEHGKGFAVVAGEVKALADQSKKATAQVRQILGEVQKATNAAVLSTEEVTKGVAAASGVAAQAGQTIGALAETLAEAAQGSAQIGASAGQQATGMAQINQAMRNIDQVANQNLAAMRQTEQATKNLNVLGTRLARLVGQ